MGLQELCGNKLLDLPSHVEAQYSDQNVHNQCANEKKDSILSKLQNLPDYLCEQLDKIIVSVFAK